MSPLIEILVHVSGPSRGVDDARYRQGALGFLNFEPVTRYTLCELNLPKDWESGEKQSSKRTNSTEGPFLLDILPSQSVWYAPSPVVRRYDTPTEALKTPKPQFKTCAAVSRQTPTTTLQRTSVKETPHLLIEQTPGLPRPRTAPTPATPSQGARPLRRTQSDSWQTPPSVIPNSQPTPATSSLSRAETSSSPYLKRPFDTNSPSPTRPKESPSAKRQRLQLVSSSAVKGPAVNGLLAFGPVLPSSSPPTAKLVVNGLPAPDLAPPSSSPKADRIPSSSSPSALRSLEIHPPRPKISTAHFKTHLTTSLTTVCTPLARFYKPVRVSRELDPLERGHWLLPLGSFDETLKGKFWDFLAAFVGEGRAGWGTWCVREHIPILQEKDSDKENCTPRVMEEVVKIYCWGQVVTEIWTILFLASSKGVKGVGASWIDASGATVVQMK